MKQTPLYDQHVLLGGKMVDFFGWAMPLQYTGIIDEHAAVRNRAGIFDVSHMGEITLCGNDARHAVQYLMTNDVHRIEDGQIMYTPMCDELGGTVDDLLVYQFSHTHYLLVVNAANTDKDYNWILQHTTAFDVEVQNESDSWAQIAVQGPLAQTILQKTTEHDLDSIRFYRFAGDAAVGGVKAIVSRTGYTGEDGFEIYTNAADAPAVWNALLSAGGDDLAPCGLGARDTLRFEAALPLYGHELSDSINPLEAGLKPFVKPDKGFFLGKAALQAYTDGDDKRKVVGLELIDKGIAREGCEVFSGDQKIGVVTSGGVSPSLGTTNALALVGSVDVQVGDMVTIAVRKRQLKAKVVKKPFYTKKYKK